MQAPRTNRDINQSHSIGSSSHVEGHPGLARPPPANRRGNPNARMAGLQAKQADHSALLALPAGHKMA
jgi:hypothetical protein